MSMHKTLVQIFCALLLVAVHAAVAHAQVYAAKFTCGRVPQPAAGDGDTDVVVGVYMTSINIYNPLSRPSRNHTG